MRVRPHVLSALTLVATFAHAQPSPEATRLFDEGRDLAKAQKWAEACERFGKSLALDPAPGTKLNLGDCLEKQGKIRDGVEMFEAAARDFDRARDGRAKFARERAAAASAKLATAVVQVTDPSQRGLAIRIGDRAATPEAEIVARIDPGPLTIRATVPGKPPFTRTVDARAGDRVVVAIPAFPAPAPPLADAPASRTRVRIAYGLGAGGLLCLAGGGVLGLLAKSQYDGAFDDGDCTRVDGRNVCSPAGKSAVDGAGRKADLATGLAIGGAALVVAGVVLYVTAPSERRISVSPIATSSTAGVMLGGRF